MEKRYQVFVSSTYEDLKEERSKIITTLLNIDCFPCGMEYFPAGDEEAWECIERLIPQCDYYVIIIGGRYGSTPKGSNKSYTHKEYELALKHNIPVLGLIHKNPSNLPFDKCEKDPIARQKLDKFREQVRRKLCRPWETADQLVGELCSSLTKQIKNSPRNGWVSATSLATADAKDEIIKLRRKIEEQEKAIRELKKRESDADDQLASGDDPVAILGKLWGNDTENKKNGVTYLEIRSTWNSVFRFLRLSFASTWDDYDLKKALQDTIEKSAKNSNSIIYRVESHSTVENVEIEKVLAQFNALNLICRRGSRWDFTSKGLVHASRMMALRKGEEHLPSNESWFDMKILRVTEERENPDHSKFFKRRQ